MADISGTVYHIMHDSATVADKIWESYQRSAIATPRDAPLFQRRALKSVPHSMVKLTVEYGQRSPALPAICYKLWRGIQVHCRNAELSIRGESRMCRLRTGGVCRYDAVTDVQNQKSRGARAGHKNRI